MRAEYLSVRSNLNVSAKSYARHCSFQLGAEHPAVKISKPSRLVSCLCVFPSDAAVASRPTLHRESHRVRTLKRTLHVPVCLIRKPLCF